MKALSIYVGAILLSPWLGRENPIPTWVYVIGILILFRTLVKDYVKIRKFQKDNLA